MYQTDFICTYKLMEGEIDQEGLYRLQLLQAFDLEQWNDEKFSDTIVDLFSKMNTNTNTNKEFYLILEKARKNPSLNEMCELLDIPETEDFIFTMLFKFEYFDLLHRCIIDYLTHGSISEKHLNNMLEAL